MEPVWSSFRLDPREPRHASLRASDADRAVVSSVLADGYADGRLSAAELDERESANLAAKTLGELPPLLEDLVVPSELPARTRSRDSAVPVPVSGDLHAAAVRSYLASVWEAGAGTATPFLICTAIWLFTTPGGYFWPMWVLIPVILTVGPMLLGAPGRVRSRERKLEKRRREALEGPADPPAESI